MDSRDRLFAEIAVRLELLTREQVVNCSQARARQSSKPFSVLAVDLGYLSAEEAELCRTQEARVLERQRAGSRSAGAPLVEERVQKIDPRSASSRPKPAPEAAGSRRRAREWAAAEPDGAVTVPRKDGAQPPRAPTVPMPLGVPSLAAPAPPMELVDTAPGAVEEPPTTRERARRDTRDEPRPRDTLDEPRQYADTAPITPSDGRLSQTLVGSGPGAERQSVEALPTSRARLSDAPTLELPRNSYERTVHAPWGLPPGVEPPKVAASGTLLTHAATGLVPPDGSEPQAIATSAQPPHTDSYLAKALALAFRQGASDLHVHGGAPLMIRVDGQLRPLSDSTPLTREATEKILAEILNDGQWAELGRRGRVAFALELPDLRCRVSAHRQRQGIDAALRIVPLRPPALDELGFPPRLARLAELDSGLVLFSGPIACGKTTTLATILSLILEARRVRVLTLENPIEYAHADGCALLHQRQIDGHADTMASALRAALREDPDVVAVSEIGDRETLSLALSAAEGGRLVLGALAGGDATRTLAQVVGAFGESERSAVRLALSESLAAVISQRLLPRASGRGRVPAFELLHSNEKVAELIRKDQLDGLSAAIKAGSAAEMVTLHESIAELIRSGMVSEDALKRSTSARGDSYSR